MSLEIYDTTLRDGAQGVGINFSVSDKLRIADHLDTLGVTVIEGGWPGANPTDTEFFEAMQTHLLRNATLAAFGATRRPGMMAQDDLQLRTLLDSMAPIVTLVGKAWDRQVADVLRTTNDENLAMIANSVRWFVEHGRRVVYDAEHFFDGYSSDAGYALRCLDAAINAGAERITLCDTNGGTLPDRVEFGRPRDHLAVRQCRRNSLSRRLRMRGRRHPRRGARRCRTGAGLHQRLR